MLLHSLRAYLTALYRLLPGLVLLGVLLPACGSAAPSPAAGTPSSAAPDQTTPGAGSGLPTPTRPGRQTTPTLTPSPAPPLPTLDVDSADLQGIQITFWHAWTGASGSALQSIVGEFNRTNQWGIQVEAVGMEGFSRLEQAVEAALPEQSLPDLLVGYNYQAARWQLNSNLLLDLNPYLLDPTWGFPPDQQADLIPLFWGQDLLPGRSGRGQPSLLRLGIPFSRSAYALFYNRSWGRQLGYSGLPDNTFGFRVRTCAAATANAEDADPENDGSGGWLVTLQPSQLAGWLLAFGSPLTPPGNLGYQFDTPEAAQALEYLKGMQQDGCAWVADEADPLTEFAARRALVTLGSLADLEAQQAAFDLTGSQDEWTVLPIPSDTGEPVMLTYGPSLLISKSTPERQLAAWLLAQWLVYPPNQARWIEASGYLPTSQATLDLLSQYAADHPQWAEAVALLPYAHSEPAQVSWGVVRWVLSDALRQLFSPAFSMEQIPELLENLDQVAEEITSQYR